MQEKTFICLHEIIDEALDKTITSAQHAEILDFIENDNNLSLRESQTPRKITIEYYVREVYGRKLEYVKDTGTAKIIANLTRQKTIDSVIRELLRDLTGGHILWKEVTCV